MSKEGCDAPVISQDSSEDDIRAAYYQIQALYVNQKSALADNQAEIDYLKESNDELRAVLDTYSKDSALTITQQGLQEDNRELRMENAGLTSKLAKTERELAALRVRTKKDIFCLTGQIHDKEQALKWEARKEKEALEKELSELKSTYKQLEQTLGRHATEAELIGGTSHYKILLEMAQCMNLMGSREEDVDSDNPKPTFRDHVHLLVRKCLEGSGFGVRQVGQCQMEVFQLLNGVYNTAAATWREKELRERDPVLPSWLSGATVKEPKRKRREEPMRRGVSNENGRPAY